MSLEPNIDVWSRNVLLNCFYENIIIKYKKVESINPDTDEFKDKISELTRCSMSAEEVYLYVKSMVHPDKFYVDELYDFAIKEHEQNNYDCAIKYYTLIKNVDSSREGVYENLALCYANKKDYQKAKEIIGGEK